MALIVSSTTATVDVMAVHRVMIPVVPSLRDRCLVVKRDPVVVIIVPIRNVPPWTFVRAQLPYGMSDDILITRVVAILPVVAMGKLIPAHSIVTPGCVQSLEYHDYNYQCVDVDDVFQSLHL